MKVARETPACARSGPGRPDRDRARLRRYAPATLALASGAFLTWATCAVTSNLEQARLRSEFQRLAWDRMGAIADSIENNLRALRALRALFENSDGVGHHEFETFTTLIFSENPGIQALEWIPRVSDAQREAYEQAARRDGLEGFQITELDSNGEATHAGHRAEYFPVFYVEPLGGNERALGFDLASSTPRAEALAEARDSGQMVATPAITLVQEEGGQLGTLVLMPKYQRGARQETVEQRRTALTGFVLGVYRLSDLLEACVAPLPPAGIDIGLTDKTTPGHEQILSYHASRTRSRDPGQPSMNPGTPGDSSCETSVTVGGRAWSLKCMPAPAFYANRLHAYPWIVLAAGLLCTFLLTAYVWKGARYTQRVERQVCERTRALVEANTALSREVAERQAAERAVRDSELKFRTLVERIPAVTYTAALDATRTTTYVSPQIEHYLGYLPDDYRANPDLWSRALYEEDRARVLAEVAACQTTGEPLVCEYRLRARDGRDVWFHDEAVLVRDERGQPLFLQGVQFDITDRKRAEDAARRQSELLSTVLNNIPHFVFWKDRDSVYLGCNANFARVAGLANPADIVGKTDYDLVWKREETESYRQCDREVMEQNRPLLNVEEHQLQAEGKETLILTSKVPLHDSEGHVAGVLGVYTDVTERKQAEEALRESETRLRTITDSAQDAILMMDPEGRVSYWNPAAERILGYTGAEAAGENLHEFLAPQRYHEAHRAAFPEFQRRGQGAAVGKTLELQARRKDGQEVTVSLSLSGVQIRGGWHAVGILRDITERKETEAKLEALHRQLLDASRQAGMAEVASGVLHNVGNVLNSLNVSATLVADKVRASRVARLTQVADLLRTHADDLGAFVTADDKGRQLPDYVRQLADHLTSDQSAILGELDALMKNVEHIKSIIHMQPGYARNLSLVEPVALAELLDEVLKMNAASFERHGLTVARDYADAPVVTVDKHMVLQVLVNLIRNARHALRDSGRPDKRLTVRAARHGDDFVRVEVRDNGVGIAAEDLARIWEYGFTTKKDGRGVGLHNSALAAKAIGGSLEARSDGPNQGATFVFEIPMRVGESAHV